MKVLITGSLGLVGQSCVQLFNEKGWEVVGIDNNMRSNLFGVEKQDGALKIDIRDEGAVNKLFSEHEFDAVIHTAAQPSHDWSGMNPMTDFHINALGTLNLLEATRTYAPYAAFVFLSTDKVYGENMVGERLSDESLGLDFAGCRSPFGCSKTAADIYVQEYGNYYGMNTACFRCGCITGKNHKGAELHGFLSYIAKCAKEGKTYNIFGNGSNVRDQIHAHDVATALYAYLQSPRPAAVYNLGGGPERAVSVMQAIELIEQETGKKIQTSFASPRKGDRLYDIHDVSKFRNDHPQWDYTYSLQDIIKDICS